MSTNTQPALFTKLGFDPAYLLAFEDKLFLEGPQTARRLTNFFALLLFATVIATYGVLSNSTATVIGANLKQGRHKANLCLQPREAVPDADIVVMHKLMIEADEETYLQTANTFALTNSDTWLNRIIWYY